ncbi:hypothetical protein Kfla_3787 [Kribbella flavida DSM 17836]|uniref:DUF4367 domain-containing protein n=1 Tax=Kribbella flavida (strain DSM 17836 / JCM 10339 / NBRC 14399) TaxID=479435 RepID=D2PPR7_KRIFD|nr:hypothetical protein [Kribbella flavida]ADB32841.1 hypothetical protein Kfla_3787 [Kribbella flavida DSM 17836]
MTEEQLADELRALGRSVDPPVAPDLTTAVLERVEGQPVRRAPAEVIRAKWRALVALLALVVAGAALAPPVRAAVAEWLNIGGVEARPVPSGPTSAPGPPTAAGRLSVEEAGRRAGLTPITPQLLGTPTGVEASDGMVAMSWDTPEGVLRLEQFSDRLSPVYVKKYYQSLEPVKVVDGYWFSTPHDLVLEDENGAERSVRVAGPTLVWVYGGTTFRLEGATGKDRATEIALSAR